MAPKGSNGSSNSHSNGPGQNTGSVVDFNEARTQKLDQKRRKTERIFFKQILNIYCVSGEKDLRSVEIVDVSEDGLSFQVPFQTKDPWPTETDDIVLRLYFTADTYLQVNVAIRNSRPCIEEGQKYVRYGCEADKTLRSYEAFRDFVRFLTSYAEHAHKDAGDVTLFYL